MPGKVASQTVPSRNAAGMQRQLCIDRHQRAERLPGTPTHADGRSLLHLRAWHRNKMARVDVLWCASQVAPAVLSWRRNDSSACHGLHSAPLHREGQDVCGYRGHGRTCAELPGAASVRGSLSRATLAARPFLPSASSALGRRASSAGYLAEGSIAASAGAGRAGR